MVSDKMAKAGLDSWAQFGKHQRDHKQVAQDIVNAAWTKFDAADPDTWPKSELSPSGMPWLIDETYFGKRRPADRPYYGKRDTLWFDHLTAYADPADLMPQREDE